MRRVLKPLRDALLLLGPQRRWRWVLLVVVAALVTGLEAIGALLVYLLLGLVGASDRPVSLPVIGPMDGTSFGLDQETFIVMMVGLIVLFFMVRAVVIVGQAYVQKRITENAGAELANHLVAGYVALPYLWHTQQNSAQLVRNAFDSVRSFIQQVLRPLVELFSESLLVLGLLTVLLATEPVAAILAIGLLGPLMFLLLRLIQPRLKQLGRRAQEAKKDSLKGLQQALGGIRDIRLLGRERHFAEQFARDRRHLARVEYLRGTLSELPRGLIESALVIAIAVVFLVGIRAGQGADGMLSALGLFAYAGFRIQPSLRNLVKSLNNLKYGSAVVEDLLDDRQRIDAALTARRNGDQPAKPRFSRVIELRDVRFRYSPEAPMALNRVDLTIKKGEFIGICGPTGGGKSTLVDIIVGLIPPSTGKVLVDDTALGSDPGWWYRQLGVVSQHVFLIDDTLRRNIAFGYDNAAIDEDRLARSIQRAQLQDVINQLPDGLETIVGERGIRLSGGQRQRVSIARALYREPEVIVFDEGTSALDGATEAALVAALGELKSGRTLISVAHRLSTVRQADRILVVKDGRIVNSGCFDELLEDSALFRTLAQ